MITTIEYSLAYFQENNCLYKLEDDQSRLHKNRNYIITNTRNYVTCILELRFKMQTNRETEQYKTHNGQAKKKNSWAFISQEGRNHATSRETALNNDDRSCFGFNHFTCLHGIRFGPGLGSLFKSIHMCYTCKFLESTDQGRQQKFINW